MIGVFFQVVERDPARGDGPTDIAGEARALQHLDPVGGGAAVDVMVAGLAGEGVRDEHGLLSELEGSEHAGQEPLLDVLQELARPDEVELLP